MTLSLDHIVIAVDDLDSAILDYHDLGFTVVRGGVHANRATHNALITFANGTYLELLAMTGETPVPGMIDFSVLLQHGEGLVGFALRSDDLEADAARLRAEGFAVSDSIPGERRRADGTVIQWKLALLDGGFTPFLIQDVTPREWRISADPAVTTHENRSVALHGVEIVVREIESSRDRYRKLFGVPLEIDLEIRPDFMAGLELREVINWASICTSDEKLLSGHRMFPNVSQEEIDAADPSLEPKSFGVNRQYYAEVLADIYQKAEEEQIMTAAIADHSEALFAIRLIREQVPDKRFTLMQTHHVRFRQLAGASPVRGEHILTGIDQQDWASIQHAYGPATDVPDLLRALASDEKAVRDHAYEVLNSTIIHQGTIYEASVETIPFLMQLLSAPEVADKPLLLDLLECVTGGIGIAELHDRTQELLKGALPFYLALLDHPDEKVRRMIISQLSIYTTEQGILEPLLRLRVMTDLASSVRAECVETLATIWTASSQDEMPRKLSEEHVGYFAELMRDMGQSFAVRFRAAQILVKNDPESWLDESVVLFYRMMENDEETLKNLDPIWLGGVFYTVIEALPKHPDYVLEWITAQAQHANPDVRELVPFILRYGFRGQPIKQLIPIISPLLRDPSPDVRQAAVGFFYNEAYASEVIDSLKDLAQNDPSLTVRVVARNTLNMASQGKRL